METTLSLLQGLPSPEPGSQKPEDSSECVRGLLMAMCPVCCRPTAWSPRHRAQLATNTKPGMRSTVALCLPGPRGLGRCHRGMRTGPSVVSSQEPCSCLKTLNASVSFSPCDERTHTHGNSDPPRYARAQTRKHEHIQGLTIARM